MVDTKFPRSALAQEIAKRFVYMRRLVMGEINRALAPLGANAALYQVLIRLAMDSQVSQQELTIDAGLDAAGVSRLVAKMAESKLVSIRVDPKDRRRRLVRLTPKGFSLVESLSPVVDQATRGVIVGLDEHEEQQLLGLLDKAVIATMQLHAERKARRGGRGAGAEPDAEADPLTGDDADTAG